MEPEVHRRWNRRRCLPPTSIRSTSGPGAQRRGVLLGNPREQNIKQSNLMEHVWDKAQDEWGASSHRRSIVRNPKRRTIPCPNDHQLPEVLWSVPPVRDLDGLREFRVFRRRIQAVLPRGVPSEDRSSPSKRNSKWMRSAGFPVDFGRGQHPICHDAFTKAAVAGGALESGTTLSPGSSCRFR